MVRISESLYLIFQHNEADLLRRLAELESLREQVRLAETAKAPPRSKARRCRINPKVIDTSAAPQLRV